MSQVQMIEHLLPTQVKIAVFEPQALVDLYIILKLKRRSCGRIQDFDLGNAHFYFTRGNVWVYGTFRPFVHFALNRKYVFVTDPVRHRKYLWVLRGVNYQLN